MGVIARHTTNSGGRKMTETHERLLAALLANGQQFIAEICECGVTEAHRKVNGESGWKLNQLAKILDALGLQIAGPENVVMTQEEYQALWVMAHKVASEKLDTFRATERRRRVVPFSGNAWENEK